MPEYGILLEDGKVIVGPDWGCVAEVMDSFHGFGSPRAYGELVVRSTDQPEWVPV